MSNRRRPRRTVPLDGAGPFTPTQRLPLALQHMEWSDEPPAAYDDQTLEWIADRRGEAMRLNAWRCEACGVPFIAYDRHPGTTPMMVSHRAFAEALDAGDLGADDPCTGSCASVFYGRDGVVRAAVDLGQGGQQIQPTHEWYRPSAPELRAESRAVRTHVRQGGLLLRKAAA